MRSATQASVKAAQAVAIGTVLGMLAVPGMAGEKAGVSMPESMEVAGEKVFLNGLGVREATWLKVDVYVAGLYLERLSKNPQEIIDSEQIKMIHMRFKRDVGRGDVHGAYRDGFKNNAGNALPALQQRIDKLLSWLPAFKDGGTLTVTYIPGKGTHIAVNGKMMGVIEGVDFARAMFSIWLGPKPPNSGLKNGMLGG